MIANQQRASNAVELVAIAIPVLVEVVVVVMLIGMVAVWAALVSVA